MKTERKIEIFLLILASLLIVHSFFGIEYSDEAFYFAVTKRFASGDRFLMDEWHPCQLIGILLLPFYHVYTGVAGNQDGIILCARILYVIFSVIVSGCLIKHLGKSGYGWSYALIASIPFCIYVRASIGTFSYYNLGLITFLISIIFYWKGNEKEKNRKIKYVVSGISLSVSVLCMPYLAIVVAIYYTIRLIKWKKYDDYQDIIYTVVGISLSAILFLAAYGRQIWDGLSSLTYIFSDPAHEGTLIGKIFNGISYIIFSYLKFLWPFYVVSFIIAIVMCCKKNEKYRSIVQKGLYLEFFLQALYSRTFFEGGIIVAFLLLAIQLQLTNPSYREKKLERYFLYPGILFGLAWIMGSNTVMRVFNMGALFADVWAIRIVLHNSGAIFGKRYKMSYIAIGILLAILTLNRFLDLYREDVIWKLDTRVSCGSMKGIITSERRAVEYETTITELRENLNANDRLAVPGTNPWIYLESPSKIGAYTAWHVDYSNEYFWEYYNMNPENRPNVILKLDPSYGQYTAWCWSSHGSEEEGSHGDLVEGILITFMENQVYESIPLQCGTLYRAK